MPKLNIPEIKRSAIKVFEKKSDMLKYIGKFAFNQYDRLVIYRVKKNWIVYLEENK